MLTDYVYISPQIAEKAAVLDDISDFIDIYDATTLKYISACPRRYQYGVIQGLREPETNLSRFLMAGRALHEAMDLFMVFSDRDMALEAMFSEWGDTDDVSCPEWEAHLTKPHLEIVLKNYMDYAATDLHRYRPIDVMLEDLNFTNILAAKFRMLGDKVILGESSILYEVEHEGFKFPYAIKPDIIVENGGGNVYVMDHKTTSAYLSEWKLREHRVSNQLRPYIFVLREILGRVIHGGLINSVYVGKSASSVKFGGSRFKLSKYLWNSDHAAEAVRNQWAWIKSTEFYRDIDYYPQASGELCRSCRYGKLCDMDPELREGVAYTDFVPNKKTPFFKI